MENAGCVSVDKAGFNKAAVGKFEKLMIFNCLGILMLISLHI
jgi:hypothetical protein